MTSPRFRALPGEHRKVYSNRSEADFVMPSPIQTVNHYHSDGGSCFEC